MPTVPMKDILSSFSTEDLEAASGSIFIAVVLGVVLYSIQVPIDFFVLVGVGLVYWPFYEFIGVLFGFGLNAFFCEREPASWEKFQKGYFPALVGLFFVGLLAFGQWFFLFVFAQSLRFWFQPPSKKEQEMGCALGALTMLLLFLVLVLAIFGLPVSLSESFHFPHVRGDLRYLPGMLIIGIGYYILMAVLSVFSRPLLEWFNSEPS